MPHLNCSYFFNLVFWCIITLMFMHYIIIKKFCFKISSIIIKRKLFINKNIYKYKIFMNKIKENKQTIIKIEKYNHFKIVKLLTLLSRKKKGEITNKEIQNKNFLKKIKIILKKDIIKFEKEVKKSIQDHKEEFHLYIKNKFIK